ncbi:MAG: hypothetical protein KJ624_02325 [Chloroflexi bacterium]|nr:hypothetical protein [Chloroflexota bacterium]
MRVDLSDSLKESGRLVLAHPFHAFALALAVLVLAAGDLVEVIPFFAPLVTSSFFPFWHEVHDLLALGLVLYLAYRLPYKLAPTLGIAGLVLFLADHGPYFFMMFPKELPEMFRLLLTGFIALLGIFMIAERRRALELAERREQEIKATAQLNLKVLNERIQLLEAIGRGKRPAPPPP